MRDAGRPIELRIEIDDSGVLLVSTKGCGWCSAGIGGGGDTHVLVVSNDEVHAVGHEVVLRQIRRMRTHGRS